MKFLFHDEAGQPHIALKSEAYKYIVKVRRQQVGERVFLRHPESSATLYTYRLTTLDGRRAELELLEAQSARTGVSQALHIGWCNVDPKSVEKVLPQLNEMGVEKITFIPCAYSQNTFRPDVARLKRILHASMQQCGRSEWMQLEQAASLEDFIGQHSQTVVLDFCDETLTDPKGIDTVLIGCEGGFSEEERMLLSGCKCVRFDTPLILRSESAAVAVAAKLLL